MKEQENRGKDNSKIKDTYFFNSQRVEGLINTYNPFKGTSNKGKLF